MDDQLSFSDRYKRKGERERERERAHQERERERKRAQLRQDEVPVAPSRAAGLRSPRPYGPLSTYGSWDSILDQDDDRGTNLSLAMTGPNSQTQDSERGFILDQLQTPHDAVPRKDTKRDGNNTTLIQDRALSTSEFPDFQGNRLDPAMYQMDDSKFKASNSQTQVSKDRPVGFPQRHLRKVLFPRLTWNSTTNQMGDSKFKAPNSETQVSRDSHGVALQFAQTLLKKVPDCVDTNPVKMAFSIAKAIIEIKDVVGDNKDELVQFLDETAIRLLGVERTVVSVVPKGAEEAMEKIKSILEKEMKELKNLADKSLATQILDDEAYGPKIQQIFQRVKEATTSFFFEMPINIQQTASEIPDDTKKAALERLRPSKKADHNTILEDLKRAVCTGHSTIPDDWVLKREVCTDGTRVKMLEDITKWANDRSLASPRVFWLTGHAGSGKTTIAYTIAKRFEIDNTNQHTVLGGNFLCSRRFEETQSHFRILPTIAYQLAHKCKSYANALHIADKFDAVDHDVSTQIKDLLVKPWQLSEAVRDSESSYLIIIDAVDELIKGGSAFLGDLLISINKYDLRRFKFLVTSRTDPKIAALFESFASVAVCRLQDVPFEEAKSDIETYLKTHLPKLTGSPNFAKLGECAGGLFIYAASAVRYLTSRDSITVGEQFRRLNDIISKRPFTSATFLIDELYRQIMYDTFSNSCGGPLARRLLILYTFLCTAEHVSASTVAALVSDGDDGDARAILRDLHAVLYTQDDRVFWYHSSFPDFIFTARSNIHVGGKYFAFSCNKAAHHRLLCESCFSIMKFALPFDIGNRRSSFLADLDKAVELSEQVNQNISAVLSYSSCYWTHHLPENQSINTFELSEQVTQNISTVLSYSSHYWTHHLPENQSINTGNLFHCISEFLQNHFLFWIEAMVQLGLHNQCTPMLQSASQWVLKHGVPSRSLELAFDIREGAEFATYFTGSLAAESTPAYSPEQSHIQMKYRVWKGLRKDTCEKVLQGHLDKVLSVTFSPDGSHVVSGSNDNTLRFWNVARHLGSVYPDNFPQISPRWSEVEARSNDITQRIWFERTHVLEAVKNDLGSVNSVVFSPDGIHVVSGSANKTVCIWDVRTGVRLSELRGHLGSVNSVVFSPDGIHVVSGSGDNTLHIWDWRTCVCLAKLKGHLGSVNSVAFSPDGIHIVSGSADHTMHIWDVRTYVCLAELKGHLGSVNSVAFSPDGIFIVSGSADHTVRIWDVLTCVCQTELKGHLSSVNSVVFSPDGSRIMSVSSDNTMHYWDVVTGVSLAKLRHLGSVNSVAFSPDGKHIVSGSNDNTVRIWKIKMVESEVPHSELPASKPIPDSESAFEIADNKSDHLQTTTCWIAAEHALQHVRNNISSVSEIFGRWQIQESDYVILAGFDESLIKSGVGYLEQIHVFVIAEIDATSPLLSELGRLFSPFSSILFTESSSYHLPVFKDNGSMWEFEELVYYTASKFADGGYSAKTPLTIISLAQTSSPADSSTGFASSGSGSEERENNKKQRSDKGKGRDTGDRDEANRDDKVPSDDPNSLPRDHDGITAGPAIFFDVTSKIHLNEVALQTFSEHEDKQNIFQTLTMHGKLNIKTTPLVENPPQYSKRFVQFTELTFGTEPTTVTDFAYKQIHLRIVVDAHQENADVKVIKPRKTPYSDGEEKQLSSLKSGRTHGMASGLTLGPQPHASVRVTATKTKEETAGSEKKLYKSAISEYHDDGKVRWGFNIDDVNFQEGGFEIREDDLPTVHFEFTGDSDEPEPPPTPPPEYMDFVITSHWKRILPSKPKHTWIHKLLHAFKSTGNAQTVSYFNLFQIVALKANLFKLQSLPVSRYRAKVVVNPGASNPHEVKVTRQASESVNVIPAVVDDPQMLTFSDESGPQKLNHSSLPIRLPTIAKFRLSENCVPIWEICDSSSEATTKLG